MENAALRWSGLFILIFGGFPSLALATGTSGSAELRDAGETPDPPVLADAITAYNANHFLTASDALLKLHEDNFYPQQDSRILYYLAMSLYKLQLYDSSQHYLVEVLKKGPDDPYFKEALPRLVAVSEYTEDNSDLLKIVAKIPPENFPRGEARNRLSYLAALKQYRDGKLANAQSFLDTVPEASPTYPQAQYLEGVIAHQQGHERQAAVLFHAVLDPHKTVPTDRALVEDLSRINLARINYGIEQYAHANSWYETVPHSSQYWPTAQFESAWSNFRLADVNRSLGLLLTVNSPYYAQHEFLPEASVLEALNYFQLCQFDNVARTLRGFRASYRPIHTELRDFLKSYSSEAGLKLADQAYGRYFGEHTPPTHLPKSLFATLLRNQEFSGLVHHLHQLDIEENLISQQKTQWRNHVGATLSEIITADRARLQGRAGRVMLSEMATIANHLGDLLTQADVIEFEMVDANRVMLTDGRTLAPTGERVPAFAVSRDKISWPFNGEFWEDELGNYRFNEISECNAR